MADWIPISKKDHETKYYLPRQDYSFASGQQVISILLPELAKLIPHYTLGFIQQNNTYVPVALTGLGSRINLYLSQNGKWLATYVPAYLRSYPFGMLTTEDKRQVLCIHKDHLVDEDSGQPLFDQEEGNLAKPVQDALNFLTECEKHRQATQTATNALGKAGIIEKWPLQVKQQEGRNPLKVEGLYRISENVLNGLDEEAFAGLRNNGALALAYGQLFSMNQVNRLTELAKYHARQQPSKSEEVDWGKDDRLWIDWDKL